MIAEHPTIEMMSTRLFPKNHGAGAYRITGIAARCDWVLLSDRKHPKTKLVKRNNIDSPRSVFLSLRAPFEALAFFMEDVLPRISTRFVLVSGSEDITVPRQLDRRWRRFSTDEHSRINALLEDPRLIHWHAENLDDANHPRLSPIPLGMVFPNPDNGHHVSTPPIPPLATRPLRVLCAHRVRPGPQWDLRREVTRLFRQHYAGFSTVLDDEVPESDFIELVRQHAFVACVEGGGLDPCPKAWQAILHGAIPIIRSTPLRRAYAGLPIAIVDQWDASALSTEKLRDWVTRYAPFHDIAGNRAATLQRLGIDEWWSRICSTPQEPELEPDDFENA